MRSPSRWLRVGALVNFHERRVSSLGPPGEVDRRSANQYLSRSAQHRDVLGEVAIRDEYVGGESLREPPVSPARPHADAASDVAAARDSATG